MSIETSYPGNLTQLKEGSQVKVSYREFIPSGEKPDSQKAVVIYPGWGANENAESYRILAEEFAKHTGRRTIILSTQPVSLLPDSINKEAKAAHDLLANDLKINDLIVVGYSEGGGFAADTVLHCQVEGKITPRALILLAPIGISRDNPARLVASFGADSMLTPLRVLRGRSFRSKYHRELTCLEKLNQTITAAKDIAKGIKREAKDTGYLGYPLRLVHDISLMVQENPRLKDITCPVILIQGRNDLPEGPKGKLNKGQMALEDEEGVIQNLINKIFKKSPHKTRILLTRDSGHISPLIRSSQIALVTSYLLSRWEKLVLKPLQQEN